MASITLVNHASVLIEDQGFGLLSDPWYFGKAFNSSWSLLEENTESEIDEILKRVHVIWISHEHPDHFSVAFFRRYIDSLIERQVMVLFQETQDKRVVSFVRSLGLKVLELADDGIAVLREGFTVKLIKYGLIDSSLLICCSGFRILNLNDCTFRSSYELRRLKKRVENLDVLLTQFGNASWKPNSAISTLDKIKWQKIATLQKQVHHLMPSILIPFASFSYWCKNESSYLNHSKATTREIAIQLKSHVNCQVLRKMSALNLSTPVDVSDTYYWDNLISTVPVSYQRPVPQSINSHLLPVYIAQVSKDLKTHNNKYLLRLLRLLRLSSVPFLVKSIDNGEVWMIDPYHGRIISKEQQSIFDINVRYDVMEMLLTSPFGLDTLIISGDFVPGRRGGLQRVIRSMWLRNINCYGYKLRISFSELIRFKACLRLLIAVVMSQLETYFKRY
jgi:UDP-MurNAc hydroxylase